MTEILSNWRNQTKKEYTCQCGATFQAYDFGPFTRKLCTPCQELENDRLRLEEAQAADNKAREEEAERVRRSRIPAKWKGTRFENSDRIHPKAFDMCRKYAEDFTIKSPSLIIHSDVFGSGKTHLAICIANHLIYDKRYEVHFVKAHDVVLELRSTFDRGSSEAEVDVFRRILSCHLLVIDDLGVDEPTGWMATTFWTLFDKRLESGLPVVVTTNYLPDDDLLGNRIGIGALGRLLEMSGNNTVSFKGKNLRREKKNNV